jgi:hypothetical protein
MQDILKFHVIVTINTDKFIVMRSILISLYVSTEHHSYISPDSKPCGRVGSVANGLSFDDSQRGTSTM